MHADQAQQLRSTLARVLPHMHASARPFGDGTGRWIVEAEPENAHDARQVGDFATRVLGRPKFTVVIG